jgi:hypothetical protein
MNQYIKTERDPIELIRVPNEYLLKKPAVIRQDEPD